MEFRLTFAFLRLEKSLNLVYDFADPISFLDLFTSTNSENDGKWKNSTYDKLIADSKTTSSTAKRWGDLSKAENILLNDAGVIPLYYSTSSALIRTSVKGVIQNRGTWPTSLIKLKRSEEIRFFFFYSNRGIILNKF